MIKDTSKSVKRELKSLDTLPISDLWKNDKLRITKTFNS